MLHYRLPQLQGVFVAMVTPFTKEEATLDIQATDRLIKFLVKKGVNGIMILGTTGEGLLLDREVRKQIAAKVLQLVPREVPVIVQTGDLTTESTVELSLHAKAIGATAIAVVVPYYYRIGQRMMIRHYSNILSEIGEFPMMVYDIPQYAGNHVETSILSELATNHKNLVGIKSSSPDFCSIYKFTEVGLTHGLSVLVGNDDLDFPILISGAAGLVSGLANVFPEVYVSLYNAITKGNYKFALSCQRAVSKLVDIFDNESQLSSIKEALNIRGVTMDNGVRSPLAPLNDDLKVNLHLQVEKFLKSMEREVIDIEI